jgi:hypothetical protein
MQAAADSEEVKAAIESAEGVVSRVPDESWTLGWEQSAFMRPGRTDDPTIAIAQTMTTGLSSPATIAPAIVNIGSNTQNWDGSSDTKFRYWPGVFSTGNGGSGDLALYGSEKPGGAAQAARWPLVVEFVTDTGNAVLELFGYALGGGAAMKLEVNGRLTDDVYFRVRSGGGPWMVTVTFPVAAARRIRVMMPGDGGFSGVRVPTGQTITKAPAPTQTIAFLGDSWVNGSGSAYGYPNGAGDLDTFAWRYARLLGGPYAAMMLAGIGGTGWTAGTSGGQPANYSVRVPAILSRNPDTLVIYGSQNDSDTDISAAVSSLLASVTSIPRVIVLSTALSGYQNQIASVRAATLAAGRLFVDLKDYMYGTGGANSAKYDGNKDVLLMNTGDLHPTLDGHRALASSAYRRTIRQLTGRF